jgi:hypothetical protein
MTSLIIANWNVMSHDHSHFNFAGIMEPEVTRNIRYGEIMKLIDKYIELHNIDILSLEEVSGLLLGNIKTQMDVFKISYLATNYDYVVKEMISPGGLPSQHLITFFKKNKISIDKECSSHYQAEYDNKHSSRTQIIHFKTRSTGSYQVRFLYCHIHGIGNPNSPAKLPLFEQLMKYINDWKTLTHNDKVIIIGDFNDDCQYIQDKRSVINIFDDAKINVHNFETTFTSFHRIILSKEKKYFITPKSEWWSRMDQIASSGNIDLATYVVYPEYLNPIDKYGMIDMIAPYDYEINTSSMINLDEIVSNHEILPTEDCSSVVWSGSLVHNPPYWYSDHTLNIYNFTIANEFSPNTDECASIL